MTTQHRQHRQRPNMGRPPMNRRKGDGVRRFKGYFKGVNRRARFQLSEAAKDVRLIDWLCIVVAFVAIAYMVFNPAQFGRLAGEAIGSRHMYQALRGVIIALGALILVDRRAVSPVTKIAVTLVVVGLSANVAENSVGVNSLGIPLKFGYLTANSGVLLWFLTIMFRVPWQQRAEAMTKDLEDAYAQGFRPRK